MNLIPNCRVGASFRCVTVTLLVVVAVKLSAQIVPKTGPQRASRTDLTALAQRLEGESTRPQLTAQARSAATGALAEVRARLERGDFSVGDRFVVTIRQDSIHSDTVSVRDSLLVTVGNLPDVSLGGVLRSELDDRINTHVARYLRDAVVRTNVLTRIAILGAVKVPGFYYAPPDRSVTDVVMLAGGPAPEANLNELEISRGQVKLMKEKESRQVMKEGRTLEQLDVRSGDEIVIPVKKKVNWQLIIQSFLLVSTLLFSAVQFLQWYYGRKNAA